MKERELLIKLSLFRQEQKNCLSYYILGTVSVGLNMARGKQSTRKTKPNSEIVKSGNEDVDKEGLKNDLKSNDKEKLKKGKKSDKKEKGRIIASLHTYCKHMSENPNEKCSGLTAVHSTLDSAHVYTFSVSRNGQTLESEASSKLEAAISLLRYVFCCSKSRFIWINEFCSFFCCAENYFQIWMILKIFMST